MPDCTICGGQLDEEPRLGDWIAHPRCRDAALALIREAQERTLRMERRRVLEQLSDLDIMPTSFTGDVLRDDTGYYEHEWSEIRRIIEGETARDVAGAMFAGYALPVGGPVCDFCGEAVPGHKQGCPRVVERRPHG